MPVAWNTSERSCGPIQFSKPHPFIGFSSFSDTGLNLAKTDFLESVGNRMKRFEAILP